MSRQLLCTVCLETWTVIEIPQPFVDPDLYTCPACLRGDLCEAEQLQLSERVDTRTYDPALAEIPF